MTWQFNFLHVIAVTMFTFCFASLEKVFKMNAVDAILPSFDPMCASHFFLVGGGGVGGEGCIQS